MLIKLARKKNRRQTESSILALKNLFLESILTNRKLLPFLAASEKLDNIDDNVLSQLYIDDYLHRAYLEVINIIEDIVINDPLKVIKKKYMAMLLEMLIRRPEREEKLLEVLINKLGDPDVDVANYTIKLLKDLQEVFVLNP
jgi:ribosome biogenesis protein MAK21